MLGFPHPHLQVCFDPVSLDCPVELLHCELMKYELTTHHIKVANLLLVGTDSIFSA